MMGNPFKRKKPFMTLFDMLVNVLKVSMGKHQREPGANSMPRAYISRHPRVRFAYHARTFCVSRAPISRHPRQFAYHARPPFVAWFKNVSDFRSFKEKDLNAAPAPDAEQHLNVRLLFSTDE